MTYNEIKDHFYNLFGTIILFEVYVMNSGVIQISCYGNDIKYIIDKLSKSNILLIDRIHLSGKLIYYNCDIYLVDLTRLKNIDI